MAGPANSAEQIHTAVLRGMEGVGTLRLAVEASDAARALALAGIAAEHPNETAREVMIRYVRRVCWPVMLPPDLR